jgi:hypothetical protein
MTIGKARPPRNPIDDLGALAPFVDAIASRVADLLRPQFEGRGNDDEFVDRKTCSHSKRWWDRNVGVAFEVFKDGRTNKAKRKAVDAAFERQSKLAPKPMPAPRADDAELEELEAAGLRLVGRGDR